jgi:SAM-dependent methyltransferase
VQGDNSQILGSAACYNARFPVWVPLSMQPYSFQFFASTQEESRRSASAVVPLVLQFVQPNSVIDVGCGVGGWLAAFREHGIQEILGLDGDYVPRELLAIPQESFLACDLTKPLRLGRSFDLVLSLEVAEHLPPSCAETLVDSLTQLGPVVLFSAAIPFQGGTDHLNEQWPEYWVKLFEARGFAVVDCLRHEIWQNPRVERWYAQNILFFASEEALAANPKLAAARKETRRTQLSLVHPRSYLEATDRTRLSLRDLLKLLPGAMGRAWRRR